MAKRVIYACPGSYDEDHQRFMSCGYVCDAQKIRRILWVADKKAPKPPVAAADDEGAAAAAAPTGGEAFSAGGAAGGLRLDPAWVAATASTASVREAAQAVAEEARRLKLSIDRMDDAELLKKCATLLIANRETLEGGGVRFGVERVIAKLASDHPQRTQREAICPANTWCARAASPPSSRWLTCAPAGSPTSLSRWLPRATIRSRLPPTAKCADSRAFERTAHVVG